MGDSQDSSADEAGDIRQRAEQIAMTRLAIAQAWTVARRARDATFGNALFSDTAWDILLSLYISRATRELASVSTVAQSTNVPIAIAKRWIAALEGLGLIEQIVGSSEPTVTDIRLSSVGLAKMRTALDACAESDTRLGLGRLRLVKQADD